MRILLMFLFLSNVGVFAQEIAPFQFEDSKALPITVDVLQQIWATEWVQVKEQNYKGKIYRETKYQMKLALMPGGKVNQKKGYTGTWSVKDKKILDIQMEQFDPNNPRSVLRGGYSVCEVSDTSLVLSKLLSSNERGRILHFFVPKDKYVRQPQKRITRVTPPMNAKGDRAQLLSELKSFYFMRNLKAPQNLDKMSEEELRALLQKENGR